MLPRNRRWLFGLVIISVLSLLWLNGQMSAISTFNHCCKYREIKRHKTVTTTKIKEAANGCPYDWDISSEFSKKEIYTQVIPTMKDWKKTKPILFYKNTKYKLDSNRYIVPLVGRGPNNQLVELRHNILLAIALNRTLVIPRFTPHRSSGFKHSKVIHPLQRIDFTVTCRLIPCVFLDDFKRFCDNEIGLVLVQPHNDITLVSIKSKLYATVAMSLKKNYVTLPSNYGYVKKFKSYSFQLKDIKTMFSSDLPCATVPFFYGNYFPQTKKFIDLEDEIDASTPLPSYITNIANDFITEVMGNRTFLSFHWRYNAEDFLKRCTEKNSSVKDNYKIFCHKIPKLNMSEIPVALMEKMNNKPSITDKVVYIATPPSEHKRMEQVTDILHREEISTFTEQDLLRYLKSRNILKRCDFLDQLYNDIISNVEMAICAKGTKFVKSGKSSWSKNVVALRRTAGLDTDGQPQQILSLMESWNT